MTEPFHDHFSGHAGDYRLYRPAYPPELFAWLAEAAPGRDLAWDCGTGNGQAAVGLAEYFAKVIATDPSAGQIAHADPHPRVEYRVAPAERSPLADHSADLVTVAQALHWFDRDRFYAEARRAAKPGGLLAVWAYDLHAVNPAVDVVLDRLQNEFVGRYWPPERALVDAGYRPLPFPFPEVPAPAFEMTADWDLPRLVGYMNTWSATRRFVRAHGFNPLDRVSAELNAAWGDPATVRAVRWAFHLKAGRVG
jgi:SAM-dependent methyltransferase